MTQNYIHGADGCILMYDITSRDSFEAVEEWAELLVDEDIKTVLVGNKSDLEQERKVSEEDGKKLAEKLTKVSEEEGKKLAEKLTKVSEEEGKNLETELKNCVAFFETSARKGDKVHETFKKLLEEIYEGKTGKVTAEGEDVVDSPFSDLKKHYGLNHVLPACKCG